MRVPKGRWCFVALAALAVAWCFASWLLAEHLVSERRARLVEREQEAASSAASSIAANASFALAHMSHIPRVLARQSEIETLLSRRAAAAPRLPVVAAQLRAVFAKDAGLSRLARRLEAMVGELGVDQVWVMDDAGNCLASGGFPSAATATGVNYLDRQYFSMAKREGVGQ